MTLRQIVHVLKTRKHWVTPGGLRVPVARWSNWMLCVMVDILPHVHVLTHLVKSQPLSQVHHPVLLLRPHLLHRPHLLLRLHPARRPPSLVSGLLRASLMIRLRLVHNSPSLAAGLLRQLVWYRSATNSVSARMEEPGSHSRRQAPQPAIRSLATVTTT